MKTLATTLLVITTLTGCGLDGIVAEVLREPTLEELKAQGQKQRFSAQNSVGVTPAMRQTMEEEAQANYKAEQKRQRAEAARRAAAEAASWDEQQRLNREAQEAERQARLATAEAEKAKQARIRAAEEAEATAQRLAAAQNENKLNELKEYRIGGTLVCGYTAQRGETFNEMAAKFNVNPQELARLNPQIANLDRIRVGQFFAAPGRCCLPGAQCWIGDRARAQNQYGY